MGCVFGEDQRGGGRCYHELTGKWQNLWQMRFWMGSQ